MKRNTPQKTVLMGIAGLFILFLPVAEAQVEIRSIDSSVIQRGQEQIKEYYEQTKEFEGLQEEEKKELINEEAPEPQVRPAPSAEAVFIERIDTDPSGILTEEELREALAPYEGRELTVADLEEAVNKINTLYREKKFIAARAFLAPQKIKDGVAHIRLIEARIGDVMIVGNKSTRDSFIRSRVPLESGGFLNTEKLEHALEHFNSVYDIDLRVELKAGKEFGQTDCLLQVQEPRKYQVTTFVDNAGREDIGLYRSGVVASDNSLFGFRDRLTLGMILAEGTMSGSASYDFPINAKGTRIGASYDWNQIEVISGAFEVLEIDGDSSNIGAFINHPLIGRSDLKVNGFLKADQKKTTTKFSDVTLVDADVGSFSYGGDLQRIDRQGLWYARAAVTHAFADMKEDDSFVRFNADMSRYQLLKKDCAVVLRASGQISGDKLFPSSEQFQLGGLATVRGYDSGLLIGENGYFLSAELNFPLFWKEQHRWRDRIKGAVFIDHGGIFPYKPSGAGATSENDFITGVGGGILINVSQYLSGRIVVAFPLDDPGNTGDSFKVHFYFQSVLF